MGTAPLVVNGVFSNNPVFIVTAPTFPQSVEPGSMMMVTVVFAPTSVEEFTGSLTIVNNDPRKETLVVLLRGVGSPPPAPQILLSENAHDFELVEVGEPVRWLVTVYNRGDLDLIVSSVSSDNSDFQVVSPIVFPTSVHPSSHMHVTIDFVPSDAGTRIGHITLSSNDPESESIVITVTGYGSAPDIELLSDL